MRKINLIVCCLLVAVVSLAQSTPEAVSLLRQVNRQFSKVKDYQADAVIDTRISFLKILPQKAKVFFKAPDMFRLKSKRIAILPKQNFDQLFKLKSDEKLYMAFISGNEMVLGKETTLLNLLPLSDTSDLVLAKLWIDPVRNLVLKSQLTTRSNGTVLIEYFHGEQSSYALPDKMIFTVEVKRFKIPKAIAADINSKASVAPAGKEAKTGKIIISFKNYLINKGIENSIFEK